MRIYTRAHLRKVLGIGDKRLEELLWAVGLGRTFHRCFNAQEAELVLGYYHANYIAGRRVRVGSGVEPEGRGSVGHSPADCPSPDADPDVTLPAEAVPKSAFRLTLHTRPHGR